MDEIEQSRLIESLDLGGGGPRPPLAGECVLVRELGPGDVGMLRVPGLPSTQPPRELRIRNSHHLLAQQIAKGHSMAECALITGYGIVTISQIKAAPAFQELVAFYQSEADRVFAEGLERMQALGLSSLDELQHRLESDPDKWANRELMELAEMMLIKPRNALGGGGAVLAPGGQGVNISVHFVRAEHPGAVTIEGTSKRED